MLTRGLAIVMAISLAACLPGSGTASPTPAATTASPVARTTAPPTTAPPATPSPTPAPVGYTSPRGLITVDQPRAFARVTSPLTVSGAAMLFEGAFVWQLMDLSGRELAKGSGQTLAGAPARGTYSFSISFTVATDTYAYLALISHSARDGSVEDEARVPLMLAAR